MMNYRKITLALLSLIYIKTATASTLACANPSPIDQRYFGMHMHRFHDPRLIATVGFGSWRLWDAGVSWAHLQPSRDTWDFRRLELALSIAGQRNIEVGLVLGMSPQWASARPKENSHAGQGSAAEPRNFADWDNYIFTVASRYKGRIKFYEIWNEPDTTAFYTGTIQQMTELTRRASEIIKKVDPLAIIVSPSPANLSALPWFTTFTEAGGLKNVDAVGYHFYTHSKSPEALIPFVSAVRNILSKHGISKPLWNTESGIENDGTTNSGYRIGPAAHVGRWLILGACLGLERFEYYSWDSDKHGLFNSTSLTKLTQATSYESTRKWLTGSIIENCVINENWSQCHLTRNSTKYTLAWADVPTPVFQVGNVVRIEDISGFVIERPGVEFQLTSIPMLLTLGSK